MVLLCGVGGRRGALDYGVESHGGSGEDERNVEDLSGHSRRLSVFTPVAIIASRSEEMIGSGIQTHP